jgi:signal peptidase I
MSAQYGNKMTLFSHHGPWVDRTLWLLLIASGLYFLYIGVYETIYSVGLYLIPPIVLLGAAIGLIVYLWPRGTVKKAIRGAIITCTIVFSGFILEHEIVRFKPTKNVIIPTTFEGTVYLIASSEPNQGDIVVNEHGIGYLEWNGNFKLSLYHGERNIDDALHASNTSEIIYYHSDSSVAAAINVWCIDVAPDMNYPTNEWHWVYRKCLDVHDYDSLVHIHAIDPNRVLVRNF